MICPKCNKKYDIYTGTVNDETGRWECPICLTELVSRVWRYEINKRPTDVEGGKQLISILKQRDKVFGSLTMYFILRATGYDLKLMFPEK